MNSAWLFKLKGEITNKQSYVLAILGLVFIWVIWVILTIGYEPIISKSILPHPSNVWFAFGELYRENELIMNLGKSISLNLGGYIKAILYALPIGFLIGLVPLFRGAFQKVVDAIRFLPLTALTGLFIIWFGIYVGAKINFLAFGIFIYLLPIVIQRIDEVEDVYLKTVQTLGATSWQTIRSVYIPSVLSRISDDIRILTAISWTYIIVAETNADQGGIGSLIYRTGQRLGRVDKTFACLIIIMIIGVFQDRLFAYLDRKFFPHKYQVSNSYEQKNLLKSTGMFDVVFDFIMVILTFVSLGIYLLLMVNEWFPFMGNIQVLSYLFGGALWTIHVVFGLVVLYQGNQLYKKFFVKS